MSSDNSGKHRRGAARRATSGLKDAKIRELSAALGEAVALLERSGITHALGDCLSTRLVSCIPGLNSAMEGNGGHISSRPARQRRNFANHEPKASTTSDQVLASGDAAPLQQQQQQQQQQHQHQHSFDLDKVVHDVVAKIGPDSFHSFDYDKVVRDVVDKVGFNSYVNRVGDLEMLVAGMAEACTRYEQLLAKSTVRIDVLEAHIARATESCASMVALQTKSSARVENLEKPIALMTEPSKEFQTRPAAVPIQSFDVPMPNAAVEVVHNPVADLRTCAFLWWSMCGNHKKQRRVEI